MNSYLAALYYLAQLSQRGRYHYTDEEIDMIEKALLDKLTYVIEAFRRGRATGHGSPPGRGGVTHTCPKPHDDAV